MPNKAVELVKTLSTTEQLVLPENPARVYALLINDGASAIYLSMGVSAIVNRGIPLLVAGSNYEINLANPWHGSIHAVAVSGTPDLLITEW